MSVLEGARFRGGWILEKVSFAEVSFKGNLLEGSFSDQLKDQVNY